MGFKIVAKFNREPVILKLLIITVIPDFEDGIEERLEDLSRRKIVWSMNYTDGPTLIEFQILA